MTPAYVHLTTKFYNGKPTVEGEIILLKSFAGEEDMTHNFTMRLYHFMQHKNDFSRKMFFEWFGSEEAKMEA